VSIFIYVIPIRALRALALISPMTLVLLAAGIAHAETDPDPVAAMIARVAPAVVRVVTVRPPTHDAVKPGVQTTDATVSDRTSMASGSGYIIDPSGYIGTNRHVIDGAISVFVVTADGVRYPAKVIGAPDQADMALLRIDAGGKPLPFVRFGDSDKMRVGDPVIAIGSPFGFDNSVTSGIVSALDRDIMESPFDDYIQTDAAINHGNSGGPLFNMAGEVIGMNSIIFAPTPGFAGLAFALPSSGLQFVFDRLMKTGEVKAGMLPIHTQQVTWMLQQALGAPGREGALVTSVQDDSGAMLLGKIQAGDVILTFDGQKVLDPRDLARKAARTPIGSVATLERCRGGTIETVHVTIQAWPEAKPIILDNEGPRSVGLRLAAAKGENGQPIVTVAEVEPTGTAADSGIQKGDAIVEVQQTPVSDPDDAKRIFREQSQLKRRFVAVLVERDKKTFWMPLAVPE
jgi:serine protease Do